MIPTCPICGNDLPELEEGQAEVTCVTRSCQASLALKGGEWKNTSLLLSKDYGIFVLPFAINDGYSETVGKLDRSKRWERRQFSSEDPEDVERTAYFALHSSFSLSFALFRG